MVRPEISETISEWPCLGKKVEEKEKMKSGNCGLETRSMLFWRKKGQFISKSPTGWKNTPLLYSLPNTIRRKEFIKRAT